MIVIATKNTGCANKNQQQNLSEKDRGLLVKIVSKIIDNPKEKKFRFVTSINWTPIAISMFSDFQFFNFKK